MRGNGTLKDWISYTNLSLISDQRSHVTKAQLASVSSESMDRYQQSLNDFAKWAHQRNLEVPEYGSVEEREAAEDYAWDYVHIEDRRGTTIQNQFSSAIKKLHTARQLKQQSWVDSPGWKNYCKGLERQSKDPTWRFPWPAEIVQDMIRFLLCLHNSNSEQSHLEMAIGLTILFFGMARSSHLQNILVGDALTRTVIVDGTEEQLAFKGLEATEYITFFLVGIKGKKRLMKGGTVKVPNIRGMFTDLLNKRKKGEPLLKYCTTTSILEFVKRYAAQMQLTVFGYVMDLHGLRHGGSVYYRTKGLSEGFIKHQAKWVADSRMIEHYSAIVHPIILDACIKMLEHLDRTKINVRVQSKERKLNHVVNQRSQVFNQETSENKEETMKKLDLIAEATAEDSESTDDEDACVTRQYEPGVNKICPNCEVRLMVPFVCRKCEKTFHKYCLKHGCCPTCKPLNAGSGTTEEHIVVKIASELWLQATAKEVPTNSETSLPSVGNQRKRESDCDHKESIKEKRKRINALLRY